MSDPEEKERHSQRRKANIVKIRRDQGDLRGAFAIKVHDPKTKYKRVRIDPNNIEDYIEEE